MSRQISPTILMKRPNEKKIIYHGFCQLLHQGITIKRKVKIYFDWIPDIKIRIQIKDVPLKQALSFRDDSLVIVGPNFEIKSLFISSISGSINADLDGYIKGEFKIGRIQGNQKVYTIEFSLLNFKNFFARGSNSKPPGIKSKSMSQLNFSSESTELSIFQYFSEADQRNLLERFGGFLSTHGGRITFKQGIGDNKYLYFLERIGLFFSFLNGRRCYPTFLKLYDENGKLISRDYSTYLVDKNKNVGSWLPQRIEDEIQNLWPNFLILTKNEDDFERMNLIIHWYLEALNNSGFINGSIILIQSSYELLFNWIFNEEKNIISTESIEKIRASDKLRLLLDKFDLDLSLPQFYLVKYKDEIKKDPTLKDFSFQFTEFRNHFVHYKSSKKSKLNDKPEGFSWSLLNSAIFNLESIILKMLKYKGKMYSRVHVTSWGGMGEIDIK